MSTDGSPAAEEVFTIGAEMARDLKLIFTLVGVVHESTGNNDGRAEVPRGEGRTACGAGSPRCATS